MAYEIHILDKDLNFVAPVRNTPKLDPDGNWLVYSKKLSSWGQCRFRVGTKDPLLTNEGDILRPYKNHVRILKDGVTVWQGVIVQNPSRNKRFVEVVALGYLYLLSRVLIRHDASDGFGAENYRTFKSGTLANSVSTMLTEAKTDMGVPLTNLALGTITNPDFPADYKDATGATLSGTWTWSDNFQIKFDYRDVLYAVQSLADYAVFDYEMSDSLSFNFEQFIGNRTSNATFSYGEFGNLDDYNVPLDGKRMANYLVGIAADNNFQILHSEWTDTDSVTANGKIAGVAAFADVKNQNLLTTRLREEGVLVKTGDPDLSLWLNDKAPLLGEWAVGDVVTVIIKDHFIDVNTKRRIVGYETKVNATGYENTQLYTNKPRDNQ